MTLDEIKGFLHSRRGYLKEGGHRLSRILDIPNVELCRQAVREVNQELKGISIGKGHTTFHVVMEKDYKKYAHNDFITTLAKSETSKVIRKDKSNVLVIGDLHLPFTLDGYLEHCKKVYKKYKKRNCLFISFKCYKSC